MIFPSSQQHLRPVRVPVRDAAPAQGGDRQHQVPDVAARQEDEDHQSGQAVREEAPVRGAEPTQAKQVLQHRDRSCRHLGSFNRKGFRSFASTVQQGRLLFVQYASLGRRWLADKMTESVPWQGRIKVFNEKHFDKKGDYLLK